MRPEMIKSPALFGLLALVVVVGAIVLVRAHIGEQPSSLEADTHGPVSTADAHMRNEAEAPPQEDAKPDELPANGGEITSATASSGVSQREWLSLRKNTLAKHIDEYGRRGSETMVRLDKSIRDLIVEAFRKGVEFEVLKDELGSTLRWQRLPDEIRVGGTSAGREASVPGYESDLSGIPEDELLKPLVLYDELSIGDGAHLYVFQNTTLLTDMGFWRLRWDVYAVVTQPDADVWELGLTGYYERDYPYTMGRGLFLIDAFIDSLGVPAVAMVRGPEGSGHFVRAEQAIIDVEERSKSRYHLVETSGMYS